MNKTCTKCSKEKPLDSYRWRNKEKGTKSPWCKECFALHERTVWAESPDRRQSNKEKNKLRRLRNSQFIWDHLSKRPCQCGESDPTVLDFDHRDPSTKTANVCDLVSGSMSLQRISAEIDKCDVLCANCHRRRTAIQQGWYTNINTT